MLKGKKLFPEGLDDMALEIRDRGRKRTRRGSVEISDDARKGTWGGNNVRSSSCGYASSGNWPGKCAARPS